MPNHITNELEIENASQETLDKIQSFISDEDGGTFHFDKILPEPTGLNSNHWRVNNWGTKWTGYDVIVHDKGFITFLTAWNTPEPIILKLSNMFPEAQFIVSYYDEDLGYNLGKYAYENGELISDYVPEGGSKEAEQFLLDRFEINMNTGYIAVDI